MHMLRLRVLLAGAGLCVGLVPAAKAQSAGCPVSKTDEAAVVDTVRTMYAAATVDDMAKLHAVFAPGAYLFDGGVRYNSVDELMQLIHDFRAKGAKFVWNVTQPDVHVHCNEAWVAFVNDGSITMPGRQRQHRRSGWSPPIWRSGMVCGRLCSSKARVCRRRRRLTRARWVLR